MGWFGGSGKESPAQEEAGYSDLGSSFDSSLSSPNMYASPSSNGGGGGAASGLQEFQEFSLQLQQQVLVQTVITDLTHKAFEKCCAAGTTRDSALTGKEVACISSVTNKWLDSNEFLAGRIQRKQQASTGQQFG